jgi:hypothetical protein
MEGEKPIQPTRRRRGAEGDVGDHPSETQEAPIMILHLSKQLADRLKCSVNLQGMPVVQAGRLDAWSGHCFRIGRVEHVMMMNDASLYTILMPARGLTSIDSFLKVFIPRVAQVWHRFDAEFDAENQEVIVLKRTNRSLIGSMNDAIQSTKFHFEYFHEVPHDFGPIDIEKRLNMVPYKAREYAAPFKLLPKLLAKG